MNDFRHPCENWAEPIGLSAAGCLSPDEQREVLGHIETCADCRGRYQQLSQLCSALVESRLQADSLESAAVERITLALAAEGKRGEEIIRSALVTRSPNTWRWIMRSPISRVAAAVVFFIAIIGATLWFHWAGATFAIADFVAPILKAKTVKYKLTTEMRGSHPMTTTSETMVLDADRTRIEMEMPDKAKEVTIQDLSQGKQLCLNSATKIATVLSFAPRAKTPADSDPFAGFRMLLVDARDKPDIKREPLGEKEIDGRRVVGFHVDIRGVDMNLWGDPKTGQPVRVEMITGMGGNMKSTMSDFVFNADMDESLFSVKPPAGYTIQHQKVDASPDMEKDLVEMFREYTNLTGGVFPETLDFMTVTSKFWTKFNVQEMWNQLQIQCESIAPGTGTPNEKQKRELEEQKQKFEERMFAIMDKMTETVTQGKPRDEEIRMMQKETSAILIPMLWERLASPKLKSNEALKRKYVEQMSKVMDVKITDGKPNEEQMRRMNEEIGKVTLQLIWEDVAPENLKANEELRHKFEKLLRNMGANQSEEQKQKWRHEFRSVLGDEMLKNLDAWEARMHKTEASQEARMREYKEAGKAKSEKFMEAQQQIQRGLQFANQLSPSADARYTGKGVSLGAADSPIFWYRPDGGKIYRVIYADLSVRESDSPPVAPNAQALPTPSSLKE
jgi:outer membrane lipoprotein-sorting protein